MITFKFAVNCETRKWNVLGEIRVGIFAKHDIPIRTELSYDYNFEWYGGAKVRCLCGALKCSGFLGAKSRGFQEDTYLWEDDDDRYSVEKIPVYDSAEDELISNANGRTEPSLDVMVKTEQLAESATFHVHPFDSVQVKGLYVNKIKTDVADEDMNLYSQDTEQTLSRKNASIWSNTAGRNYRLGPRSMSTKRSRAYNGGLKFNMVLMCVLIIMHLKVKIQQLRDEALQHATQDGSATPSISVSVNDNDVYLAVVGGTNEKGNVYWLGALNKRFRDSKFFKYPVFDSQVVDQIKEMRGTIERLNTELMEKEKTFEKKTEHLQTEIQKQNEQIRKQSEQMQFIMQHFNLDSLMGASHIISDDATVD